MKTRIFNISIGSSSLNNFASSFLHLLQVIETTNVLSKRYFRFFRFSILNSNNAK